MARIHKSQNENDCILASRIQNQLLSMWQLAGPFSSIWFILRWEKLRPGAENVPQIETDGKARTSHLGVQAPEPQDSFGQW